MLIVGGTYFLTAEKESELKQRIHKQFLSNRWSQPSDIFPILDEAKREFPKTPENCIEDMTYPEEVRYWFKRWFGGAEK